MPRAGFSRRTYLNFGLLSLVQYTPFRYQNSVARMRGGPGWPLMTLVAMTACRFLFPQFAGIPTIQGCRSGPAYDAEKRPVMFFDHPSHIKNNPEGEGLRLIRDAIAG
jgi:hypothetical protein